MVEKSGKVANPPAKAKRRAGAQRHKEGKNISPSPVLSPEGRGEGCVDD